MSSPLLIYRQEISAAVQYDGLMLDGKPIPLSVPPAVSRCLFLVARPSCSLLAVRTRMMNSLSHSICIVFTIQYKALGFHLCTSSIRHLRSACMYLILILFQNVYLVLGIPVARSLFYCNLKFCDRLPVQQISFRVYFPHYLNDRRQESQSEAHVLPLSVVVSCNIQSSMEFGRT